ncbi:MAG TPA: dihydrofolate reductase family protein, partial [Phycisphaerales bacterium]|nr:dihydrofolate reductase family protein [Phycisphaerales bacterium]
VLAEGGAGLVGRLLGADLIDEALVFTAGMMLGDERALPPAKGNEVVSLAAARRFELMDTRRVGGDVMTQWRRK